MVFKMSQVYENSLKVGYTAKCTPLTKEQLRGRIKAASARVKTGDLISQQQMERRA
jgi:hypothetical protein